MYKEKKSQAHKGELRLGHVLSVFLAPRETMMAACAALFQKAMGKASKRDWSIQSSLGNEAPKHEMRALQRVGLIALVSLGSVWC